MELLDTTRARRVVAGMAAGAFGFTAPLVVSSLSEAAVQGHSASSRDADGDKMPNRWERHHGLDPLTANARKDADHDGSQNLTEFREGTDPQDDDSDDDGVEDGDDDSPDGDCEDSDRAGSLRSDSSDDGDDCEDHASSTRTAQWVVAW